MTIAAVSIRQKGMEDVKAYFAQTKRNISDITSPLKEGGRRMLQSVDRNFKEAGRPRPWKPLSRGYLLWKLRHGYSPLPLTKSGDLRRSVTFRVSRNRLFIGTSNPYASFHQFGTRSLPKRAFLVFQESDLKRIQDLILKHISGEGR